MNKEQAIVYVHSQIVCAQAEIEAMKAANMERERKGLALAYPEEAFAAIEGKYGLSDNAVISFFNRYD